MTDHRTPDELEGLARGSLPGEQARAALDHLVRGCGDCGAILGAVVPFLAPMRARQAKQPPLERGRRADPPAPAGDRAPAVFVEHALPESSSAAQEVGRAAAALAALHQGGIAALAASSALSPLTACLALLRQARELRHGEPGALAETALWATLAARALEPGRYGAELVADLQARTRAELGNAYRVADDLPAAEKALAEASALARRGTGAPALRALLLEFRGSLYGVLRRFTEAFGMFDAARALYAERGERHQVGRVLVSKGLYTSYANDLERAVHLLHEGLAMVDAERDPQLALAAVHNITRTLAELGRLAEARALLQRNRERYERHGEPRVLLKRTWIEGSIAAGLGELEEAERCFLEARSGFKLAGAPYDFALVSLDLAAVWLRQGQTLLARQLVEDAAAIFKHLGITREALAAVLVLQRAFELEVASVALLEPVASYLRRLARDPTARFEPAER